MTNYYKQHQKTIRRIRNPAKTQNSKAQRRLWVQSPREAIVENYPGGGQEKVLFRCRLRRSFLQLLPVLKNSGTRRDKTYYP